MGVAFVGILKGGRFFYSRKLHRMWSQTLDSCVRSTIRSFSDESYPPSWLFLCKKKGEMFGIMHTVSVVAKLCIPQL